MRAIDTLYLTCEGKILGACCLFNVCYILVIGVLYVVSCYDWPCYNDTQLYKVFCSLTYGEQNIQ